MSLWTFFQEESLANSFKAIGFESIRQLTKKISFYLQDIKQGRWNASKLYGVSNTQSTNHPHNSSEVSRLANLGVLRDKTLRTWAISSPYRPKYTRTVHHGNAQSNCTDMSPSGRQHSKLIRIQTAGILPRGTCTPFVNTIFQCFTASPSVDWRIDADLELTMLNKNRKNILIAVIVLPAAVTFVSIAAWNWNDQCIGRTQSIIWQNGPIDWSVQSVDDLTLDQITAYLSWKNTTSCRVLHYFGGFVRDFFVDGQRPVCLDPAVIPELPSYNDWVKLEDYTKCLVYSFGINHEWSFDDAMEKFECQVFSFDPSMYSPNYNRTDQIHFYNLGLANRDETLRINSKRNWTMKSLDSIYHNLLRHQERIIDYLKLDIEFSEFTVLPQIIASGMMDRVRQLGMEVHIDNIDEKNNTFKTIRDRIKVIKSLEDYGLVRFDSVPSPWSNYVSIVDGVEWNDYTAYDMAWYNPKLNRN